MAQEREWRGRTGRWYGGAIIRIRLEIGDIIGHRRSHTACSSGVRPNRLRVHQSREESHLVPFACLERTDQGSSDDVRAMIDYVYVFNIIAHFGICVLDEYFLVVGVVVFIVFVKQDPKRTLRGLSGGGIVQD